MTNLLELQETLGSCSSGLVGRFIDMWMSRWAGGLRWPIIQPDLPDSSGWAPWSLSQ